MTTSLACGSAGSAAERRAAMFPLSPVINNGRSTIFTVPKGPLLDPRYHHQETTPSEIAQMVDQQWLGRSRPLHTRAQLDAMLGKK